MKSSPVIINSQEEQLSGKENEIFNIKLKYQLLYHYMSLLTVFLDWSERGTMEMD